MTAPGLGVAMLCHDDLGLATHLAGRWLDGGAALAVHVDAAADPAAAAAMRTALGPRGAVFVPARHTAWGTFALVEAALDAAAVLLAAAPAPTHVILVSGSCLPLRPPAELSAWLARHPDTDFVESVNAAEASWARGGLQTERNTLYFPFRFRDQRRLFETAVRWQRRLGVRRTAPHGIIPHLGSQWWCLTARTLRAILDDPRRPAFDRFYRRSWIPDESCIQTLGRLHGPRIDGRSLTLAPFDAVGRPVTLHDDHADLLASSGCFVARKVWPGARALLARFPEASADATRSPDPDPFTTRVEAAARRRRQGAPGLYGPARWPRPDAETARTAAPYAMLHGLGDLWPGLPAWLGAHTGAVVHGALFAPEGAAFAGGAPVGPGGWSARPGLRDGDPRGFLAAMVAGAGARRCGFLYGPRDLPRLTWLTATDRHARIVAVTGAWLLPLARSAGTIDDVRRTAARLHAAEADHVAALDSVWRRASLTRWTLAEAVADPMAVVAAAFAALDAPAPPPAVPGPVPLAEVGTLIARLRRAGVPVPLVGPPSAIPEPPGD